MRSTARSGVRGRRFAFAAGIGLALSFLYLLLLSPPFINWLMYLGWSERLYGFGDIIYESDARIRWPYWLPLVLDLLVIFTLVGVLGVRVASVRRRTGRWSVPARSRWLIGGVAGAMLAGPWAESLMTVDPHSRMQQFYLDILRDPLEFMLALVYYLVCLLIPFLASLCFRLSFADHPQPSGPGG